MAGKTLISIRNARKTYVMGEVEVHALREASLDVREGELLCVLGPSGSGKSTLLYLIGGMDRPTEGEVLFEDQDLARASDRALTRFRRREVGFVFQLYNLVPMLTAVENVEVATALAEDPMDPLEALKLVGLADRAHHFPSQMSGGEQQRVAIARALAGQPGILLADEPTGALDVESGKQVLELLVDLNQRLSRTVVIITHNTLIARVAHRVARILDGRIVSVEENTERAAVSELDW